MDWWTLGVLIFELDSGNPPFDAQEDIKIFEKIMHGQVKHCFHGHYRSSLLSFLLPTLKPHYLGTLKQLLLHIFC